MAARLHVSEVIRLCVREFNRITVGGGVRLLKCESCGKLTDRGIILDRDIVEETTPGQLEKVGHERWLLCPECSRGFVEKANAFTEELIKSLEK
jgi:hypothetical protein